MKLINTLLALSLVTLSSCSIHSGNGYFAASLGTNYDNFHQSAEGIDIEKENNSESFREGMDGIKKVVYATQAASVLKSGFSTYRSIKNTATHANTSNINSVEATKQAKISSEAATEQAKIKAEELTLPPLPPQ
jgi:glutathionyl-hydroquinone reductase